MSSPPPRPARHVPAAPSSGASDRPSTATLAALGRAAGEVAHDFDNALMAIVTHASLIRAEAPSAASVGHAEAILRAARAASEIVERVRGRLREPRERPFDEVAFDRLVDDALIVARARAAHRQVHIERLGRAPGPISGQRAELLQLVTNLVNNAVDASEPGGVVTVEVGGEREVVLAVRDRGLGIPPAILGRVFEPFFSTKGADGTGLGLALARSIAESHGGDVALESATYGPERGTLARVTLPLSVPGHGEPERAPTDLHLDGLAAGGRVVIVDDDRNMREALTVLFGAAGFVATSAANKAEALERAGAADVVITDLQIGPESGAELVLELARLHPGLPIVVVSGALGGVRHDERWQADVAASFDKPVSPARLIARARELVAQRRVR